jgi:hypothetical protein
MMYDPATRDARIGLAQAISKLRKFFAGGLLALAYMALIIATTAPH